MTVKPARIVLLGIIFSALAAGGMQARGGGKMKISSPDFGNNEMIPKKFTCEGEDLSPGLVIEGIPAQAKSLALVVDDPDAPLGTWVHWVVYDMPPSGRIGPNSVPGKQGTNDFGKRKYGGPCPPSGTHRYFFKIYALDAMLELKEGLQKNELEHLLQGHILEKAELVGLYKRTG
jgi:Raf kinase inhibitor-like YbhB/YbcL family protein